MAFTVDDFQKIWASTSPLTPYEFSEQNYKEGWNFIGVTPPARQMWDFLQKLTDEKIQYIYNNMIPVGIVQAFAGDTIPDGWLLCDGSEISRTDYANLYSVIGDTYGAGDGSTTFTLPNLVNRFIEGGLASGAYIGAGLPNITGNFAYTVSSGDDVTDGAFGKNFISENGVLDGGSASNVKYTSNNFDASRVNGIYGNSNTVQPNALGMQYIIKY